MKPITFFDTETRRNSKEILDIGAIKNDGSIFHSNSLKDFANFLSNTEYICGHNIIKHDLKYISKAFSNRLLNQFLILDTLYFSPLLFPQKPYHHLLKDDILQSEESNNPVNDSIKAKELFYDEIAAFNKLDNLLKKIQISLLR